MTQERVGESLFTLDYQPWKRKRSERRLSSLPLVPAIHVIDVVSNIQITCSTSLYCTEYFKRKFTDWISSET